MLQFAVGKQKLVISSEGRLHDEVSFGLPLSHLFGCLLPFVLDFLDLLPISLLVLTRLLVLPFLFSFIFVSGLLGLVNQNFYLLELNARYNIFLLLYLLLK